ncbi:MAG: hypothetical protein COB12_10155 [Flavobacterium sp.]|nr:MAG: hypothetical protein COB12_10155 [Flavobacterium sp.]
MKTALNNIQAQYNGFLQTSLLWENSVLGLKQLKLPTKEMTVFNETIPDNLRLGKRVERFVSHELKQHKAIEILIENVQIQNEKITIGELDCILKLDKTPIHLEIVYKFYLYDEQVGNMELEHWIGPNRNDSLVAKLTKLKNKQLPLLYHPLTEPMLDALNLKTDGMQQFVCFKAQLFVPYQKEVKFTLLNNECVNGFYIPISEIIQFTDCKFYIPSKINWLLEVHTQVKWLSYLLFSEEIHQIIDQKTAPLCWIKFPNGTLQKFFVVWWT